MARRVQAAAAQPDGVQPSSRVLPSRPLLELSVVYGTDPAPAEEEVRGAVVKLRVVVPEELIPRWEAEGAEEFRAALSRAAFAYPAEVDLRSPRQAEESRVIAARDPEPALREYVGQLGIPEGDAALVLAEGLDCLHACGIL